MIKSIISSNVRRLMVLSLMESNSSPTWSLPERNAAPVRGRSQIRTPRCWEGLCGSGVGSKTIPMGLRRVSRIRPEVDVAAAPAAAVGGLLFMLPAIAVAASGPKLFAGADGC